MGSIEQMARFLEAGKSQVTFRPSGRSMTPLIRDHEQVTVYRVTRADRLEQGDIVLCKIRGRHVLHKVLRNDPVFMSALIGNNHGGINGWVPWARVCGIRLVSPSPERIAYYAPNSIAQDAPEGAQE